MLAVSDCLEWLEKSRILGVLKHECYVTSGSPGPLVLFMP